MAQTSLIIGDTNWAVKEDSLLGYNVIQNNYLPIPIDCVRATTATRVNEQGLIEIVPRNLLTYSEDYSNANWIKANSPTMTYNSAIAPNGTLTASGIKSNDATNYKSINQTISSISPNSTFTYSIYVKKETSETFFGGLSLYFSGGTAKVFYGIINAVNGTVTLASSSITPTIQVIDFGTYWRIIATATDTGSNTSVLAEYYATFSQNGTSLSTGIGSVRTIWGAQIDNGSVATEYFPTTNRLDIPRIDYSTGTASLLVEPQRTNQYPYSQQFNQWSIIGGITVTENDAISPDGTQNADRAQFTLSTDLLYRSGTGSAGSNTLTVYAKAKSGTSQKFRFFGNGGLSYSSDQVATNQWQRFTFTYTYSATTAGLAGATTGAGDVLFYGFQHEIGSYATSYIPTLGASSVTRNADVISKTGISSLIGQTEGTIFLEANIQKRNASDFYIAISNGLSLAEAIYLNQPSSGNLNVLFRTGALTPTIVVLSANWNIGNNKIAIAYNSTLGEVFINGVSKGTVALTAIPTCNQIALGSRPDSPGGLIGAGPYKQAILYKTRLSNSELAQLTTL